MLDESAHLSSTILALGITRPRDREFRVGALLSGVLIDADHVPEFIFGWKGISRGSPRPYTHSILTIMAVFVASRLAPNSRRPFLDGVAFGLATHFLRDITDGSGGAPLLWPITKRAVKLPKLQTPLVLAALCWSEVARCR